MRGRFEGGKGEIFHSRLTEHFSESVRWEQLWHLPKEADPILQKERGSLSLCLLSLFLSPLAYHSLLFFFAFVSFFGFFLLLFLGEEGE